MIFEVGQHRLRVADDLKTFGFVRIVGQRDAPDLDVFVGSYDHLDTTVNAVIASMKFSHMRPEPGVAVVGVPYADRPRARGPECTGVEVPEVETRA